MSLVHWIGYVYGEKYSRSTGGEIGFETKLGEGTKFLVSLPMGKSE